MQGAQAIPEGRDAVVNPPSPAFSAAYLWFPDIVWSMVVLRLSAYKPPADLFLGIFRIKYF